jgi:hypothetical protein
MTSAIHRAQQQGEAVQRLVDRITAETFAKNTEFIGENVTVKHGVVTLYQSKIAWWDKPVDGAKTVCLTTAGKPTKTTLSRLNAICFELFDEQPFKIIGGKLCYVTGQREQFPKYLADDAIVCVRLHPLEGDDDGEEAANVSRREGYDAVEPSCS